ncbi:MAG: phosphatidylserine/phosphatidylglycerophosphate/cardiolipin synthase family protein [Haloferacaceae archaeon]
MRPPARLVSLAALCLVAGSLLATSAAAADPHLVAVVPNPAADGDAGERVVVHPAGVANLTLTDGETHVTVPDATEPVALAADPAAARNRTDYRVVAAPGLALANDGERLDLRLRRENRTVDTLAYGSAPEAERYANGSWRPRGLQPRSVRRHGPANATAFVLPDSHGLPLGALRGADERIFLAGYTLSSPRVADALVAASRRGVEVRVLLEGAPVGGVTRREAAALDRLTRAGVAVRLVGGARSRFAYHHPKYAVVDDRALVLTENWTPGGVGGGDNRGWGVRVDDPAVAADLAGLFRADSTAHDARPWHRVRANLSTDVRPAAEGSYPSRLDPRSFRVERVSVLTAPGNAGDAVVSLVDDAERRADLIGPSAAPESRVVRALVRAARRGVEVRVLLGSAWYNEAENRAVVERLNTIAERDDLPLTARLAEPGGRYGSIHAKGLVVDDTAVVGSLNWNDHAASENREVTLALHGEAVAGYYRRAFAADWRGGGSRVPAPLVVAALLAAGLAVVVLRRRVSWRDEAREPSADERWPLAEDDGHDGESPWRRE